MSAFPKYVKINTIWKRTQGKEIVLGAYATPEFEFLRETLFEWTEKVDGTNVRVYWDGQTLRFGGRTDNAEMPIKLVDALNDLFAAASLTAAFPDATPDEPVALYGEGYGAGIQSGRPYRSTPSFILFDVLVGSWWLTRESVFDVSTKLGLDVVNHLRVCNLAAASDAVQHGLVESAFPGVRIEGMVGRPLVDLFDRKGARIMAKIKTKDFQRIAES